MCPTCCMLMTLDLTTNDPGEMQTMLNKLRTYAEKKGLTVSTAKSEVVHFNSKFVSPLLNPFTSDGVVLPEKDRFKYLGMLLDRRMDPKIAEEHAVRPTWLHRAGFLSLPRVTI